MVLKKKSPIKSSVTLPGGFVLSDGLYCAVYGYLFLFSYPNYIAKELLLHFVEEEGNEA